MKVLDVFSNYDQAPVHGKAWIAGSIPGFVRDFFAKASSTPREGRWIDDGRAGSWVL